VAESICAPPRPHRVLDARRDVPGDEVVAGGGPHDGQPALGITDNGNMYGIRPF